MKTKNGLKVTDIGMDYWSRVLVKIEGIKNRTFVIVNKSIHSICGEGEPDSPLNDEYQLDDESLDELWDMYGGKAVL